MRLLALLAVAAVAATAHLVGHSVQGRRIVAYELGDSAAARKVLVVGCLHGNECAGVAVINRLRRLSPLDGVDLWLVPDANPDGHAAGKRRNAHRVDLNRNFPHRWRRLRGAYYSGPRPASEPETRALMRLIRHVRPAVTIWFHQHLNMVVLTRGNLGLQHRFARLAGLRRLLPLALPGHGDRLVERDLSRHDRLRRRASSWAPVGSPHCTARRGGTSRRAAARGARLEERLAASA